MASDCWRQRLLEGTRHAPRGLRMWTSSPGDRRGLLRIARSVGSVRLGREINCHFRTLSLPPSQPIRSSGMTRRFCESLKIRCHSAQSIQCVLLGNWEVNPWLLFLKLMQSLNSFGFRDQLAYLIIQLCIPGFQTSTLKENIRNHSFGGRRTSLYTDRLSHLQAYSHRTAKRDDVINICGNCGKSKRECIPAFSNPTGQAKATKTFSCSVM